LADGVAAAGAGLFLVRFHDLIIVQNKFLARVKINLASICKTWDEHPMDKMIPVGIPLPADAVKQIDELAQSQYLSRAAAVRVIILQELARRAQAAEASTAQEVAA
jgi:hypothetical protein